MSEENFDKKRAAKKCVISYTRCRTGLPSSYMIFMYNRSLNRTTSVPIETWNLCGALLILIQGSQRSARFYSNFSVFGDMLSSFGILSSLYCLLGEWCANGRCNLRSLSRVRKVLAGISMVE